MSVQGEIDRIKGNVAAAYAAVSAKGGALPETQNSENLPGAVESIPGPYIAGNGVSFEETEDGTAINLETPVQELTEAEYYALPEERKNHGLYFLPDAQPSGGGSGNSSMEVYDGEERVIGTWFGKPLYGKGYTVSGRTSSASQLLINLDNDPSKIPIKCYGEVTVGDGIVYPIPFTRPASTSSDVLSFTFYRNKSKGIRYVINWNAENDFVAQFYIEYTKTTDEAVSE